jgi:putative transposase
MDLFNHEIISYEISTRNTTAIALEPILRLVVARNCEGVVLLCGRGPTYRSEEYQILLAKNKIISSYSRAGNCWDNALMESFYKTLKRELLNDAGFKTKDEARHALVSYIELYYNGIRKHSALGYLAPREYEELNS